MRFSVRSERRRFPDDDGGEATGSSGPVGPSFLLRVRSFSPRIVSSHRYSFYCPHFCPPPLLCTSSSVRVSGQLVACGTHVCVNTVFFTTCVVVVARTWFAQLSEIGTEFLSIAHDLDNRKTSRAFWAWNGTAAISGSCRFAFHVAADPSNTDLPYFPFQCGNNPKLHAPPRYAAVGRLLHNSH